MHCFNLHFIGNRFTIFSSKLAINFAVRINYYQDIVFTIIVCIVISNCYNIAQIKIIDIKKIKLNFDIKEKIESTIEKFVYKYFCKMLER